MEQMIGYSCSNALINGCFMWKQPHVILLKYPAYYFSRSICLEEIILPFIKRQ